MKYILFFLSVLAIVIIASCKTKPAAVETSKPVDLTELERLWKKVDSLEKKGLVSSAYEVVQKIKRTSLAGQSSEHLIKAEVHENKYQNQLEEDSAIKALLRGEENLKSFPEPAKSVMHSLLGQWYYDYLQGHLWQLKSTTEYTGPAGADIRTWGIRHFIDRIHDHYTASVQWNGLKGAKVENYAVLLTESQNTDALRPTLYDILMHRALDFFAGSESFLTRPVYDFTLTDPSAFGPAESFVASTFSTADSTNHTWKELNWFQQLLAYRLGDTENRAALLDADLKRLRFVYDHIVVDGKDSLYEKSLDRLAAVNENNPESALVNYYLAQLWIQQAGQWQGDKSSPYRDRYKKARDLCVITNRKYPDSYGGQLCNTLLQQIDQKTLSASLESVQLPNEELLAKIEYRNIPSAFAKIVKLPESPRRWKGESWDGEKILGRLNQLPEVRSWNQPLKETEDFQPHATEIGIGSLPLGHYALLLSDQKDFAPKSSTTGTMFFTISELGYWLLDDRDAGRVAAVLNRKTGQPAAGVKVEFMTYEYNAGLRQQVENKIGEGISNKEGWVDVPVQENNNISVRLTKDEDEIYPEDSYYTYRYSREADANPMTLFFSDRAIYRPGQKIYFKGYAVEVSGKGMPAMVTNKSIEVILRDANGQEVTKKSFTTNTYGTFAGHFDLPQGGLTGQMTITSSYGASSHGFRVEEYKRPKFEVTFDTLKETVRLDEEVRLTGISNDYAGSPVPGAQVGYRVERVSYLPWWYGYWRRHWPVQDDRQVLAVGQGITDEEGKVDIRFVAKSKSGSDQQLMYRFEITVFVTDITGESHEATKTLTLNKQGYEVNISLQDRMAVDQLKEVEINAVNSDGAKVDVSGILEVRNISGPDHNKRERLWESPDVLTIPESEYSSKYIHYFSPGKELMSTWPLGSRVETQSIDVRGSSKTDLSAILSKPGYYALKWKWRDVRGNELVIDQYIMVYAADATLPGHEVLQLHWKEMDYEPGQEVRADLLTGLTSPPKAIKITERRAIAATRSWLTVPVSNDLSLTVRDEDRGGASLTYLAVYNNRYYKQKQSISVPWTNKELKVELKTWRDKLEPGDDETWTITATGNKGEQVTAEMLLSMYDASLDAFVPHTWSMSLYPSFYSRMMIQGAETREVQYWGLSHHWDQQYQDVPIRQYRDINTYGYYPEGAYGRYYRGGPTGRTEDGVIMMQAEAMPSANADAREKNADMAGEESPPPSQDISTAPKSQSPPPLRSALDETVFFYPQIQTDENGRLSFSFKMKEGLTRWKFQALAHTKQLAYGLTKQEVVTQKKLMVFPNPPRFFRAGDTIAFQIKITNLADTDLTGNSTLKILDAFTNEDISRQWKMERAEQAMQVKKGGSTAVTWMLHIPADWTRPVKYQVYAVAGTFTDGEESFLPVVTNRVLITETLPLPMKAEETRTFVFKSMLENNSSTLSSHQYVVEMTSSPAWYAVQALPYLMEYPHECAEQIFSRLYANTLAAHIVNTNPAIRQVYDNWRQTGDDALLSNLEKNKDLKSAMLEETPWVRDAMGETNQKKDIALLFETNRMKMETQQAMEKLKQMQLTNGGFPWFPGGRDSWYITQYIVEGFGHLKKMKVAVPANVSTEIIRKAVPYLDSRMIEWYDELKKLELAGKLKMSDHQVSSLQVHYLYTRSFYPDIQQLAKVDEIKEYLRSQIEKYWLQHGIYDQGLMALASFRTWPEANISKEILASLRERTIVHDELGRYWKIPAGFYWNESPVELQSLMVELYQDMGVPHAEVDELRVWLLKQKQTTRWKTTKATASAIYALLIHPDAWLTSTGIVEVKLGQRVVIDSKSDAEAGTGYVKKTWPGNEMQKEWSSVTVKNPNKHIAWGSAYWQYWEDLDKVKSEVEDNPLKVTRTLLLATNADRGEQTKLANGKNLKVGDKLIVRLTIETDRAMEFVHLKDMRASGFEPMDVLSGYRWSGGLGYYQSTKDLATHFFVDYLPRGKYVVEYPVTVAQAGAYSEGLATLQCMYAPEFASHTSGSRVWAGAN